MASILVTGGAGFIGSHVASKLLQRGHSVTIVDNLSGGYLSNIPSGARFYKSDCENYGFMSDIFDEVQPEYVFHLAAYAAEGLSHFIRNYNYVNNLMASVNIINLCVLHKVKHCVFTSSMSIYGEQKPPFNEDMPYNPDDPYAVAKQAVEQDLKLAHKMWGLDYTIFRPHNCYSDDTEILTRCGFKFIKDVTYTDELATLNPETHNLEWQKPIALQKKYFSGKMLHFNSPNNSYDLLVTPEHKIWCKKSRKFGKFSFIPAIDIFKQNNYNWFMDKSASWVGENIPDIILPEVLDARSNKISNHQVNGASKTIPIELWVEFLGWFISEGSAFKYTTKDKKHTEFTVAITQSKKVNLAKYNEIVVLLTKMGFKPDTSSKNIRIHSKQLYLYVTSIFRGGAINKFIPKEIKNLPKNLLQILFNTLIKGDGNINGKSSWCYTTVSKQLADDMVEICLKLGMAASYNTYIINLPNRNTIYKVKINSSQCNPQLGSTNTKKVFISEVDYNNFVYDVTVPKYHTIYVRRNGMGVWSSNCYGPNQNIWDFYRNVIGIFIYQALHDKALTIFGDGSQIRAFSYIDDISIPIADSIVNNKFINNTINIGGDQPYTILQLAELVKKVAKDIDNKDVTFDFQPPRVEVHEAYSDHSKLREFYDYRSNVDLETGIREMYQWAKMQPDRPLFTWSKSNIEVMDKLPTKWEKALR